MLARETILLALYAASSGAAASQSCYSLTGALLDQSFAPCNPDAKHSGCCATNRTSGADVCLDSGLCMSTTSEYMGTIWQPGCTDSTGKATECPQVCPGMNNNFDGLNPVSGWNIQTCDFGTYCCRAINDNRSCCNNSTAPSFTSSTLGGYNFQAAAVDSSSPTVVTTTAVASGPSATGPPPNEGPKLIPNADVCESEKHKTLVVGGTIGGVLGAAVVGLLGLVFWMAKREQRQRKLKEHYEEQFAQTWAYRKHMAASTTSVKTESHEMKTTDHHEEFMSKASGS